jgi:hypothetical protein
MLAGILRMCCWALLEWFLALCVVVFPMMFGRGAMGLGGILVMFGCFVVGIFRHGFPPVSVG